MGGQTISKLRGSLITRPIQRFNIESRTEKLLAKEVPQRAPQYPSAQEMIDTIKRERPDIIEAASKKDTDLLKKLEDVYVSSQDPQHFDRDINSKISHNPERPMPGKGVRSSRAFGFSEASQLKANVNHGKITIDTAQDIIGEFSKHPTRETLTSLSSTHA